MNATVVLDWRRPAARLAARLWARLDAGRSAPWWARVGGGLGTPAARTLMAHRIAARGSPPPGAPLIVSLGNLRVGGTGKTPLARDLARTLAARGWRGVIVTRGYGSASRGPTQVAADDPRAGDEARLLAAAEPAWTVLQSADRAAGLAAAISLRPEVVVLEDGHQSARTPRHLDALILDRWRVCAGEFTPLAGPLLPWGPYREGPEGAQRATVWLVEVAADAEAASLPRAGQGGRRLLAFRREMGLGTMLPAGAPWGLLAGLARPEGFVRGCAELLGRPPRLVILADDHRAYTAPEVARALAAGRARGVECWVTTAKDAVKLTSLWPAEPPLLTVGLEIVWPTNETLPDLVEERLARQDVGG